MPRTPVGRGSDKDLSENPLLLSGLVFAGANEKKHGVDEDDGYLTAEEVTALNLSGTKLVVLSACESGLGKIESGEGIMGLRRDLPPTFVPPYVREQPKATPG